MIFNYQLSIERRIIQVEKLPEMRTINYERAC